MSSLEQSLEAETERLLFLKDAPIYFVALEGLHVIAVGFYFYEYDAGEHKFSFLKITSRIALNTRV